ncbi:DMT family transporter [Neptunicoccus cionae]|uniref:Permease n=1 Tax=Neptunicoccus cionae TaxID=2035344 RepID=A0A916VRJ6_9RHOB|nr:DMT family transporter [Amylibacter cionae]GGA22846.1 permease [Amylibacter cionae]
MTAPHSRGLLNWSLLLLLGMIWGASFMGSKFALSGFGPFTVAALRIALGAVALTVMIYALGRTLPAWSGPNGKRIWLHCLGMALFSNAIPFTLLSWGQLRVTSGFAGITMAVVPLLVLPLAFLLVPGEQMSLRKIIGFCVGFAGTIVLIGIDALSLSGADLEGIARLACVAAASCYAIGSIITRLCPPVSNMGFAAGALLLASGIMVPLAFLIEGVPHAPTGEAIWGVLYLGVFPTALATIMLVTVINSAGPSFLSMVNYQVPVWAVVFGVLLLGEPLPGQFLWALGLILLGLAISQVRFRRIV